GEITPFLSVPIPPGEGSALETATRPGRASDDSPCYSLAMMSDHGVSRRSFLAASGVAGLAFGATPATIPVGLELYSVRDELAKDTMATLRAVARDGYQVVEFYAPYFAWTSDYAKQVRKLMDSLGIRCNSTHNGGDSLAPEGIGKAIELNQILGS